MQKNLWELRKLNGKTQKDMANLLGISIRTYRDKENGKNAFTQDEMFEISKYYKEKLDKIFLPRSHQNG